MQRAVLGATGIEVSKLCFGTGTSGWNGRSNQSALGVRGLADLLHYVYDLGVTFWDTADQYGTHAHVKEALKRIERSRVVIASKTCAEDAATAQSDIERFLREMDTDYIDIVLLHCLTDADWPRSMRP